MHTSCDTAASPGDTHAQPCRPPAAPRDRSCPRLHRGGAARRAGAGVVVAGARRRHRRAGAREPVLSRPQRRPRRRRAAAEGHAGGRAHRRRDRRGHRDPALPQRGPAADRGALRVPRLDAGRGARDDGARRRAGDRRADPREAARAAGVRQRQARRQDHRAARAGAAQRVFDERGQHPAGRRRAGRAAVHRTDRTTRRPLPLRVPHRRRAALSLARPRRQPTAASRPPRICGRAWPPTCRSI